MDKVYACSDIHGNYNLWKQISDYCDATDTIYFLGDAIDRGPDGIKILNEMFRDIRVRMIKGNHENMLAEWVPELLEGNFSNYSLWSYNGGDLTWKTLEALYPDSAMWYVKKINSLPEQLTYNSPNGHSIFMTHAGTDLTGNIPADYLWDREHFYSDHPADMPNVIQVHGHTPIQNLAYQFFWDDKVNEMHKNPQIFSYCNDHKIDIDLGCFASHKIALLDLDTLEPIYFYDKEMD